MPFETFSFFTKFFLAELGLSPLLCKQACSSCGEQGLLSSCGCTAYGGGFSCCRAQAQGRMGCIVIARGLSHPYCMWNLPRPEIEPVSLALVSRLSTTGPPGKSLKFFLRISSNLKLCLHFTGLQYLLL